MVRNRDWGHDQRLLYQLGDEKGQFVQFVDAQPIQELVANWLQSQALTVSNSVVQLNSGFRLSHNYARITVEVDQVRLWLSDKDPSSSDGNLVSPGDIITLETAEEVRDIKFIRVTTDATLMVEYGNR